MCASDEIDYEIAKLADPRARSSKNCYHLLQYEYTSPPGVVGDYSIYIYFIENIPESPDTSVVREILYLRTYPASHSREEVYQKVLSRYGDPSVALRNELGSEDHNIVACWGEFITVNSCRYERDNEASSLYMDLRNTEFSSLGGLGTSSNYSLRLELQDEEYARQRSQARPQYLESLRNERTPVI